MGNGINGYITITAGVGEAGPSGPQRHLTTEGKRELAERLRKQGWSFRRISAELKMPYLSVRQLLDVDLPVQRGETPGYSLVDAPPRPIGTSVSGLRGSMLSAGGTSVTTIVSVDPDGLLVRRLDDLAAAQDRQLAATQALERRLVDAMQRENRSLLDKILKGFRDIISQLRSGGLGIF